MLFSDRATFPLARELRTAGAPIGAVFSFLSGLYFRGKLAYAQAFARPGGVDGPLTGSGVLVITPSAGLRSPDTSITLDGLRAFAAVDVRCDNAAYRRPLEVSAGTLASEIGVEAEVVLLGSIASPKYVDVLEAVFGERLLFPAAFVGRGDMSRGGLMLRCVTARRELDYIPLQGAIRRGQRPPRLEPLRRGFGSRTPKVGPSARAITSDASAVSRASASRVPESGRGRRGRA
jgi:hypothetical protein